MIGHVSISALLCTLAFGFVSRASLPDDVEVTESAPTALEAPELAPDFDVDEALDLAEDDTKKAEDEARRESVEVAGLFDFFTGGDKPAPVIVPPRARGGRRHSRHHRGYEYEQSETAPPSEEPSSCRALGRGMASWYGGRGRTASGDRLNGGAYTAAHRTLPFGTVVLVTNMQNGLTVHVTINDRGPFGGGRIIDLTPAARRAIGMDGLALVTLHACL